MWAYAGVYISCASSPDIYILSLVSTDVLLFASVIVYFCRSSLYLAHTAYFKAFEVITSMIALGEAVAICFIQSVLESRAPHCDIIIIILICAVVLRLAAALWIVLAYAQIRCDPPPA